MSGWQKHGQNMGNMPEFGKIGVLYGMVYLLVCPGGMVGHMVAMAAKG